MGHPRRRWAVLQPLRQRFQRLGLALGHHLDAAIVQVARVAAQSERACLHSRRGAEADALHPAIHPEAGRGHQAPSSAAASASAAAPGSDFSAGPPLPSIAVSISFAVTGPRNWRATLPSGAIR